MTASTIIASANIATTVTQLPARAPNANLAEALQDAASAREQAVQQAQQQAQQIQRDVQREVQREIQRDMERMQRDIERATREAARAGREGRPGVFQPGPFPGSGPQIPEGVVIMSVAFFVMCAVIAIGFPIARAFARRMDRRGASAPTADSDSKARLERIEQAVDAIAVEVERISEGQRFTTKVLNDLRALPQGDPSVAIPDRSAVPLSRAREAR